MTSTEIPRPSVLIVSGIPGAGKTTVSRLLARDIAYSALIDGDVVHELVFNGRVYLAQRKDVLSPAGNLGPVDEVAKQLELHDRNVAALADNLAAASFVVVVDDVFVVRWRLDRFLALLRTRPVFMATLDPAKAVAESRDALRPEKTVFPAWSHLYEQIHAEKAGIGLWIDSTNQTAEETASEVLERVWREGLVSPQS